ncbi:MAG TPA: C39 family peptidase [Syntrophomonadaceae bacterium]|nr:C39 family peptidase [Syntrophomonadaceae bacterium]
MAKVPDPEDSSFWDLVILGYYPKIVNFIYYLTQDRFLALANWNINSTTSSSSKSFCTITAQINSNQPMIAVWNLSSGDSHAVVIRGFYENTDVSPKVQQVYYADPGDGNYHITDYNWFAGNSSYIWVNTLYNIYV